MMQPRRCHVSGGASSSWPFDQGMAWSNGHQLKPTRSGRDCGDVVDEVAEREVDVHAVVAPGRTEVLLKQGRLPRGLIGGGDLEPGRRAGVTALSAVATGEARPRCRRTD